MYKTDFIGKNQMKIGIVTYFNVPNYGAVLQAYALQRYLQFRGHHIVFVDYAWGRGNFSLNQLLLSRVRKFVHKKLTHNRSSTSFLSFQHFEKTKRYNTVVSILHDPLDCECFIVGSDQMWALSADRRHTFPLRFLDVFDHKALRIAYAVSFGKPVPKELSEEVGRYMQKFSAISVREKNTVEWVRDLSGREAKWLCDPTLLLKSEYYDKLFPSDIPLDLSGAYIFKYILPWETVGDGILDGIEKHLGIAHIKTDMCYPNTWIDIVCGIRSKIEVEDWLQRIKYATFVITNSFHGTLFSIIYKKPFLTLPLTGHAASMNDRIFSVLGFLGLEDRIYDASNSNYSLSKLLNSPINWTDVHLRLDNWRNQTDDYFRTLAL